MDYPNGDRYIGRLKIISPTVKEPFTIPTKTYIKLRSAHPTAKVNFTSTLEAEIIKASTHIYL